MNQAEIKAQNDAARIVAVTNPFDFDFTHAWGGVPYTLPMGKTLLFPYHLADHLATHLARHSLIKKSPMRDEKETDGKGKDRPLWSEEAIEEIKKSIMKEQYTEERKPVLSESEALAQKIADLNAAFEGLNERVNAQSAPAPVAAATPAPAIAAAVISATPSGDIISVNKEGQTEVIVERASAFKDKAEVIAELTKRGIPFDARKTKIELQKLLEQPAN